MSSGDTPPARFTSPSLTGTSTKKYPGMPKSSMSNNNNSNNSNNPNTNTGNRNLQTRQRLLSSKISAPRPINLPSLRREHAVGSDAPVSSPATSHGWGSASSSPGISHQQPAQKDTEPSLQPSELKQDTEVINESSDDMTTAATPPVLISAPSNTRAWAVPTSTQKVPPPSTDFPTAAEAATKKYSLIDDKEYLNYASSNPNHTSWDEMVSEDLEEFSVDVVEFDDGTKVQIESDTSSIGSNGSAVVAPKATSSDSVSPSERFTDDYDRSYPPKQHYHHDNNDHNQQQQQQQQQQHQHHKSNYKPYGYNPRYNTNYNSRRLSTEGRYSSASGTSDRWTHNTTSTTTLSSRRDTMEPSHYGNRRPSYDRKHDHATTLSQKPRRLSEQSFRSDHSCEKNPLHIIPDPISTTTDTREEIIIAQTNIMTTAAERAKKRLEEQAAIFKANAERAKQKADALAEALAMKQAEVQEKKIWKKPAAVDKPDVQETPTESTAKSTKSSVSTRSVASAKASFQPTTKASSPTKIPDTSKPWNLVAANKQAPTQSSTSPVAAAAAPVNNEPKHKHPSSSSSASPPAPTQILKKETKPVTIMKKEPKPTLADDKKEEKANDDTSKKPLTEDEKKWENFVTAIKTEVPNKKHTSSGDWNSYADRLLTTTAELDAIAADNRKKLIKEVEKDIQREKQQRKSTTATPQQDQQTVKVMKDDERQKPATAVTPEQEQQTVKAIEEDEQQKHATATTLQQEQTVEVMDYDNEAWGTVPMALANNRGGWIRDEHVYNQQRGSRGSGHDGSRGGRSSSSNRDTVVSMSHVGRAGNNSNNRNKTTTSSNSTSEHWRRLDTHDEDKPEVVVEILKKHEPEKKMISKKTRLTNLLKESSSPIFPDFIDKLAAKKPANMSFMVDTEESDKEITMMGQQTKTTIKVEEEAFSVAKSATIATSNSNNNNSATSSLPNSQCSQQRKMNVNRHFPVLVYQYPNQTSTATTSDKVGSPTPESLSTHHSPPQHHPMGVYLMPQQPYLTNHQFIVPYPQVGTGNGQPIYYPKLSWQQQQQQGQQQQTIASSRPSYDQQQQQQQHRRPFNNNYNDYASPTSTNAFKHNRGSSHRKRGGGGGYALGAVQAWSGLMDDSVERGASGGRGDYRQRHHYNSGYTTNKRYNNNRNNNNRNDNDAHLVVDGSTISSLSPLTTATVDIAESTSTTM